MRDGQSAATPWWKNLWTWVVVAGAVIAIVVVIRVALPTVEAKSGTTDNDSAATPAAPAYDGAALASETEQAVLDAYEVDEFSEIEATDNWTTWRIEPVMSHMNAASQPVPADVDEHRAFANVTLALAGHEVSDPVLGDIVEQAARNELTSDQAIDAIRRHVQG